MSTTLQVQTLLDEAAIRFGDPQKTHFGNALLLGFYNDSCEDITTRWQMLEVDAAFSWLAGEDRYSYPDDCVQMLRLQYNSSGVDGTHGPTDQNLWRKAHQKWEHEYTRITDGHKPTGDDKIYYWARTNFFVVWPVPTTSLYLSGLMGYWKMATRATVGTDLVELPNALRRLIRDRMIVGMKESLSRTAEARADLEVWEARMDEVGPRIEDPVEDRREHYEPARPSDSVRVV